MREIKTFAFIDATNLIYGASREGWKMDFEKLLHYLKTRFGASRVFYYAGLDSENKKQLRFYEKLQEFGYHLRLVPVKIFRDGTKKADVDSRMTFEMMRYLPSYERVVVMTGDGDFYWVLEYVLKMKGKLWIMSFPHRTARELKELIKGDFANLNNLRHSLKMNEQKNEADSTNDSASRDYAASLSNKKENVKA